MLKRHDRFKPQAPQEFARGGQNAKSSKGLGIRGLDGLTTTTNAREPSWPTVGVRSDWRSSMCQNNERGLHGLQGASCAPRTS